MTQFVALLSLFTFLCFFTPIHSSNFLDKQDVEHIRHDVKEHYYVELDDKVKDEELEFYNFQLHDYDKNLLLDGLELLLAINHDDTLSSSDKGQLERMGYYEKQNFWQKKFDGDANAILDQYDLDHDGFISFVEYMDVKSKMK